MKNKNQKNLKNKKYRWGAYGPPQKFRSGVSPHFQHFTTFYCVFLRILPENGFLFPIIAVLLQPKTKQKRFRAL